jgi:FMN phosphatase YigB (HAD superfamily)
MLNAVLLDLDNTLVLYDELEYYKAYFNTLNEYFSHDFSAEDLRTRVINGTMALRENRGGKSNLDCFLEVFARGCETKTAALWERFMDFYREVYDAIPVAVTLPDGLQDALARLRRTRLKLVIASNPIFPVIAQEKRLRWGNLEPAWFHQFTHMENMHHVKPAADYYRQACELIGEAPATCLMVGNDPVNDMAASRAGLATYLTTDADAIDYSSLTLTANQHQKEAALPEPDFKGPLAGVADVVERLMAAGS